MVQTRSMTASVKKAVAGSKKLEAARKAATEAVRQRAASSAKRLLTKGVPKEDTIATFSRLLDAFYAAITCNERISRLFPVMEYILTPGGEFLMKNDNFRITTDKTIQRLLMENPPIKLACLLCRVHQKYFP